MCVGYKDNIKFKLFIKKKVSEGAVEYEKKSIIVVSIVIVVIVKYLYIYILQLMKKKQLFELKNRLK